ncbi:unnamed protein product [Thlaspi arvense]|uniref:Zinc-ribbon domain-containing protein n=1 Tax=Thlaspi arvense TaxID=13288 RepID=A0AAU9S774_THLAR|nr:unnamed protein product [Thlaspi arvense]
MAESTLEVKLVRCPKCKNLLPEPKDCSFFQCGGCGTVLCAKNKGRDEADPVADKSVENRAKETEVNSGSTEEESDSDASLRERHQQVGQTETWDPSSKLNVVDSGSNDSQSGLARSRKRTTKRYGSEGFRFSTSNYFPDSLSSDEAIRQDRAGLVRKLDKLKEELLQPKEQHIPSSSSGFEKAPLRFPSSGKHVAGPSYYHQYTEPEQSPCPYNSNPDVFLHGPTARVPAPHRFQMHEGTLEQSHPHYSRQYIGGNNGHDLFNTQPRNGMLHQSTCSCLHCYDPYHRASGSVFPPSGLPDALHNLGYYPHERSIGFRSSLHSPRTFIPPHHAGSQSRGPQLHGRRSSEFVGAPISRLRPLKAVSSSSGGSRLIRPVAGGAPFISCKNCSKLLKLPDETDSATRKQQRLRCGACSCLVEFSFVDKKLVLSKDHAASAKKAESHRMVHWLTAVNFSSDDYDNDPAYEFHAMDRGPADDDVSTGPALISDKAQEMQIADSTSPSVSEDELSSDSRKLIPELPLREHLDCSSINVRDRSGPRSQSSRSEQDRVTLSSKTSMRQNSMKEASVAIEMDVNDYSHNSQDSASDHREDHGRTRKGGFASIVKNSFKDLKKSIQNEGRSDVMVNGHPVAERLVKMAEKQAGPIRPGNYWYDYRAGFWGIMGGQCLGILPPFIEELNYPMPENCAGGTTRVFVNGRELHQKDLRLLAARGLPRDSDRSYTVYISGRVIDEDTGEELDSLGKLAPTVDKLKRGFGMRVPRRAP